MLEKLNLRTGRCGLCPLFFPAQHPVPLLLLSIVWSSLGTHLSTLGYETLETLEALTMKWTREPLARGLPHSATVVPSSRVRPGTVGNAGKRGALFPLRLLNWWHWLCPDAELTAWSCPGPSCGQRLHTRAEESRAEIWSERLRDSSDGIPVRIWIQFCVKLLDFISYLSQYVPCLDSAIELGFWHL